MSRSATKAKPISLDKPQEPVKHVNNIMRHNYRPLNEREQSAIKAVKDVGLRFVELLHEIGETDHFVRGGQQMPIEVTEDTKQASRELALAQTHIEQAVMWATKHCSR